MLVLAYPIVRPMGLPISIDVTTTKTFQVIDNLKPGSKVAFTSDFAGGIAIPEMYPMCKILIQHLFLKPGIIVIFLAMNTLSPILMDKIMSEINKNGKEYGKDYVYLGYTAGGLTASTLLADNLLSATNVDFYGKPLSGFPAMNGIKGATDFALVICCAQQDYNFWLGPWQAKYGVPVILGVAGVNVADAMIYWNSNQIVGFVKGARGAAEYEKVLGYPGDAIASMDAQSLTQLLVIGLIIVGNVKFFLYDKKALKKEVIK
jgi:hypothetical protein